MSTTARRPLQQAVRDAEAFRALFPADTYERWEIAGSVRRKCREVGDIEHVVIPRFGDKPGSGLFPERVNLLWFAVDEMVSAGKLSKHIYSNGFKWGERLRGIDFAGQHHEIWTAATDTWGNILTIRTGPWQFSKRMVTQIRDNGLECDHGQVRYIGGGNVAQCPDERTFFAFCREKYIEPEDRK